MVKALFGAGCFWGIEEYFRNIDGITDTKVGYSGGKTINPSYEDVCKGDTDHAEVIQINFDENNISFQEIMSHFWKCHDPTQLNRQGPDVGRQYRSVIYYFSKEQKDIAIVSKKQAETSLSKLIVTEISEAKVFYLAEEYHQLFIKKRA